MTSAQDLVKQVMDFRATIERLGIDEGDVVTVKGPTGRTVQFRVLAIMDTALILGPV